MNILICGVQISDERGKLVLATKLEKQVYCDLYPPPTLFLKQLEIKYLPKPVPPTLVSETHFLLGELSPQKRGEERGW